jgi:glycosyltransferase involved in cell wall biosynthesis
MSGAEISRSDLNRPEKPIRLLLVAPALTILGGQAVQANYLLEHLSREREFEVSFVPHNPRLPGPFRLLQSIKYVRTIVTSLVYCINLLIQVPKHDIVQTLSASYWSFLLGPTPAILIARFFGKKSIVNYRSGQAEDHLRNWPRTAVPIMKLADGIIVPSQYLVDVFRKFGLHAFAIANVIDNTRFKYREREPLQPIFLSNRNMYPLYNVACILRAFAKIQQRFPEAKLILAGDGPQRPALESLARELKLKNIEFRGRVSPSKMHELYNESHIFLNSPNIDNMPGSILESCSPACLWCRRVPVEFVASLHMGERACWFRETIMRRWLRVPSVCWNRQSLRRLSCATPTRSVRRIPGPPSVNHGSRPTHASPGGMDHAL